MLIIKSTAALPCAPQRGVAAAAEKTTHTNCQNHMLMSKHGAHQNPAFTKAIPATCSKVQRHALYPCSTWHFWFMCVCHSCTGCHADSPFKPQQACAANVFVVGFKQTTAVEENTWSYRHDPTRYNWWVKPCSCKDLQNLRGAYCTLPQTFHLASMLWVHLATYSSQPTQKSLIMLKHLVSYLVCHEDLSKNIPRVIWSFKDFTRNITHTKHAHQWLEAIAR